MIINKKIKRSMLENKSQYFGSIILITISCLLYTMLNLLSSNMENMTSDLKTNYNLEDASFITNSKLNNIKELESKFNANIEECKTFDYNISEKKALRIFSQNTKVNIPAIIEGKKLNSNDILIDPSFAKANNLLIGSQIKIFDKTFKISGYMSLPNYIYLLKSENDIISTPESFGIAVISNEDFNDLKNYSSFYSIKFNNTNNIKNTENLGSQFRAYLKNNDIIITNWTDISDNKRVSFVDTKIKSISQISSSVPVVILILTCILTGIVLWRLINNESSLIGTLYAQGYRKKEIKNHYVKYPLLIALIGGILGTVLGLLLFRPMLDYMVGYFNIPITHINYDLKHIILSLLLPIIFLGISEIFVINKQLKYSPVELMKGTKEKNKVNFLERKLSLENLNFSSKFKIREQLRSLSRLFFLLSGVVFSTMLLLLGFTAKSSLDFIMKDSVNNTYKFQYEYVFNSLQTETPPKNSETFSAYNFTLKNNNKTDFIISGINSDSKLISLKDKKGTELNKENVIITKPLSEKLKAGPGDEIEVINKLDSKEYKIKIGSVAETYVGEYIFIPLSKFNDIFKLPENSYIGLWSTDKLQIPSELLYSNRSMEESMKDFNSSIQPVQSTIGVISFISFIIGLVVIYVVTSLIIEENKNTISLMKIFGYRKKELNSLILDSSLYVIILGYLIGIPLIMASMSVLLSSLTESIKITMPVKINLGYIIFGFVVTILTYELSKALSKKKLNRISMSESLKSGNE